MSSFLSDRRVRVAAIALVAVVVIGAVLVARSSSNDRASGDQATATTVTTSPASASTSVSPSTDPVPTLVAPTTSTTQATNSSTPANHDPHAPLAQLPLTVTQTRTTGLHDGDTVSFHIVPTAGSQVFGVSIRLCKADATFPALDDFEPATAGKCIGHALSARSDLLVETAGSPPYGGLDAAFRVGVGTDTYTMTDGTPVSITCGPASPCQLVLLLQVPDAFGFQTVPVTYG